jgi:hypothetical protein
MLKTTPAVVSQPKPSTPRAQIPEELPPVRIPTPEELGIGAPTATPSDSSKVAPTPAPSMVSNDAPVDWTLIEHKLDKVGATGYQVEKVATGFRFTVQLSTGNIVGRGASKGEAVRNAMSQLR